MEPPPALAALRIRTITTFLDLPANELSWPSIVKDAGRFLKAAQTAFEGAGYEVQTVRIATTPFEAWNPHPAQLIPRIKFLESLCNAQGAPLLKGSCWRGLHVRHASPFICIMLQKYSGWCCAHRLSYVHV